VMAGKRFTWTNRQPNPILAREHVLIMPSQTWTITCLSPLVPCMSALPRPTSDLVPPLFS
jgi:hypothetical protein